MPSFAVTGDGAGQARILRFFCGEAGFPSVAQAVAARALAAGRPGFPCATLRLLFAPYPRLFKTDARSSRMEMVRLRRGALESAAAQTRSSARWRQGGPNSQLSGLESHALPLRNTPVCSRLIQDYRAKLAQQNYKASPWRFINHRAASPILDKVGGMEIRIPNLSVWNPMGYPSPSLRWFKTVARSSRKKLVKLERGVPWIVAPLRIRFSTRWEQGGVGFPTQEFGT